VKVGLNKGTVVLLALPMASLACFILALVYSTRVPDAEDWKQAVDVVLEGYADGDCVVFDPPWAQEGAPLLAGRDVITTETVDWYQVGKRSRVWVLSSLGRRAPGLPEGFREIRTVTGDRVDVRLFEAPAAGKLRYDFLERIGDARVRRVYKNRMVRCENFKDERWFCGGVHRWQYVGRRIRDIAGAVREVIWAHPLDRGNKLEIEYPKVTPGATLVIRYGLTQRAIETGEGAPLTFQVHVAGAPVLDRVLGTTEDGWFEQRVDLSGHQEPLAVRFTVFTPNYKDRQLCFTADVWD